MDQIERDHIDQIDAEYTAWLECGGDVQVYEQSFAQWVTNTLEDDVDADVSAHAYDAYLEGFLPED